MSKKSTLTFEGEDGKGFRITISPTGEKEPLFNVAVELLKKEELEETAEEGIIEIESEVPEMHMVIALDTIMKMKSDPVTFHVEMDGFDIEVEDAATEVEAISSMNRGPIAEA